MRHQLSAIISITMFAILPIWNLQVRAVHHGTSARRDVVQNVTDAVTEGVRNGATFTFKIYRGLPTYTFRLIGNRELNTIERIEVLKGNESTIIQVLKDLETDGPPYRGASYFQAEDINFDGYRDIKLLTQWGATGNKGYSYWIFEPKKRPIPFQSRVERACQPDREL